MSQPKEKLPSPSDAFVECLIDGASLVAGCELCGRTHFGDGSGDYDEGELQDLLKKAQEEPDKYFQHFDDDMVRTGYINGKRVVIGCPCNELYRFEHFIWTHRDLIMEYLTTRCKAKVKDAAEFFKALRLAKAALASQKPAKGRKLYLD